MSTLKSYPKFVMAGAIGTIILLVFFWHANSYLEKLEIDRQEMYTVEKLSE